MTKLLLLLSSLPARLLRGLRAHLPKLLIAGGLLSAACVLRSCYYAGQIAAVLDTAPRPLSRRQTRVLIQAVAQDQALLIRAKGQADSSRRLALRAEAHIAIQQTHLDSLSHAYHALSAQQLTAAAAHQYLLHYVPGPDEL